MIEPRLVPDMAFDEYLAHEGYGSSDLHTFRAGPPAMVPWRRQNRDDGTSATIVGTAAHCAILTPDLYGKRYVAKPDGMTFASKEGKAARNEWMQRSLTILTHDEAQTVAAVVRAFDCKAAARDSLVGALHSEASVLWTDRESGLPSKGRPDWFDSECVYDLKISVAATRGLEAIRYGAVRDGWFHQVAHNRAGLNKAGYFKVKKGRLVVIAPKPPVQFRVWLLEVKENDMDFLELSNENTRREMAKCWRRGEWPGTPEVWTEVELPVTAAFTDNEIEGAEDYTDV